MMDAKIRRHRRAWAAKPVLRRVYRRFFRDVLSRCSSLSPIVELGAGGGFLHESHPETIATDIKPTPWADRIVDACAMPFDDNSIGNLVLIDVFHHLPRPLVFLEQASRVLQPGGRVVMLEPWTSALGCLFYKAIRRVSGEQADASVDPEDPFHEDKCPLDGNAALSRMFFGSRGTRRPIGHLPGSLNLMDVEKLPAVSWMLSGGFQSFSMLPLSLLPLTDLADRALRPLGGLVALRAMITLERPPALSLTDQVHQSAPARTLVKRVTSVAEPQTADKQYADHHIAG